MDKQYYRHVAGANPPDPGLMGERSPNVPKIKRWLAGLEKRTKQQRARGEGCSLREMQRVRALTKKWMAHE